MTDPRVVFEMTDGPAWRDGRPLARLAEVVAGHRARTTRARDRGDTMIRLAEHISKAGVPAEVIAREPDGARWSLTIHGRRDDAEVRGSDF